MTTDERAALRRAFLAYADDVPLSIDEACAFIGWSRKTLMASTVPRGHEPKTYFLRSQIIAWCKANTPHRLGDNPDVVLITNTPTPIVLPMRLAK